MQRPGPGSAKSGPRLHNDSGGTKAAMHFTAYTALIPALIQWEEVTAVTGVVALIGTVFAFVTGAIVDKKINEFLVKLNGTYWRKELAESEIRRVDERIDMIRQPRSNHPAVGR